MNIDNKIIFDVTEDDFEKKVIKTSFKTPVLVDFWAPWCAPCKILTPLLEKITDEYQGSFFLAKVNTDEYPKLAQSFQVQGIPSIKLFKDGNIKTEFSGAIPEQKIRQFLDPFITRPEDIELTKIQDLLENGKIKKTIPKLRNFCRKYPENHSALINLAELLLNEKGVEFRKEAIGYLESIKKYSSFFNKAQSLLQKESYKNKDATGEHLKKITDDLEKNPKNWNLRFEFAQILLGKDEYTESLENFLLVLENSAGDLKKEAHGSILSVFELMGQTHPEVMKFRRRLANAIF